MIAHEGVEGAEGGPARTEGFGGVASETTDIGANHGNLENGGEIQNTGDAEAVLLPGADVVAEPLAYVLAETDKLNDRLAIVNVYDREELTVERVIKNGRRSGRRCTIDSLEAIDIMEPQKL